MFGGSEWLFSAGATLGGTMGQQVKGRHMRAVVITEPGEPEVMQWLDVPDPSPGPGEVVIDVAASGVNRADLMQQSGSTSGRSSTPGRSKRSSTGSCPCRRPLRRTG
jgi:hypothetical protein